MGLRRTTERRAEKDGRDGDGWPTRWEGRLRDRDEAVEDAREENVERELDKAAHARL
jgi:hypothetical protein